LLLAGVVVNAVAIIAGSLIGLVLPNIPTQMKNTVMNGLALAVILIGLGFGLADQKDILFIIVSLVLGGIIGEWLRIEDWLLRAGQFFETKSKSLTNGEMADAFVTASLIFCVGSLAVVGAVQSGLSGNNIPLYTKSLLDFTTSIVLSSTMGIGVSFAALPVFLYEGAIAVLAYFAGTAINSPSVIACMTAVGGLLIVAIGFNLLEIKKIAVGNLLPSLVVAVLLKVAAIHIHLHL